MAGTKRAHGISTEGPAGTRRLGGPVGAVLVAVAAVAVVLLVVYGPDGSFSLVDGPVPTLVVEAALAGIVVGVLGRPAIWWLTWGIGIAVVAAAVVGCLDWRLRATGVIVEHYPPSFLLWVWGAVVALGVAVAGSWHGPPVVRVVRWVTVPVAAFSAFLLINTHYGYWPTMGALLGRPVAGQVSGRGLIEAVDGHGRESTLGRFGPVAISGPAGFDPGRAYVWIPPAYAEVRRAALAVLVMLPGFPGSPSDWNRAGLVVPLADAWAAHHGGVAPVMVFVSGNGAADHDTECVNGRPGRAQTYLTHDVVAYITHRLGIHHDPARWGAVGFSEGGTCALGLATEDPRIFGRVVDISGEISPTWGHGARSTLEGLYGGNRVAMLRHGTHWLLTHHRYPHTVGWFAAGAQDPYHEAVARTLAEEGATAGMRTYDLSGGQGSHSWTYARETFDSLYPALVRSMPSPPGIGPGDGRAGRHPFVADRGHDERHRAT